MKIFFYECIDKGPEELKDFIVKKCHVISSAIKNLNYSKGEFIVKYNLAKLILKENYNYTNYLFSLTYLDKLDYCLYNDKIKYWNNVVSKKKYENENQIKKAI